MADKTAIEWTEATWNPITGCSVVSPGCTNCYAMRLAGTRLRNHPTRKGLTVEAKARGVEAGGRQGSKKSYPVWNGAVRFNEKMLTDPLRWKRPRMIFVCAHADLFHDEVPDEWIDQVFAVMALAPQHTFQVLTKRPERMREYMTGDNPLMRIHSRAAADVTGGYATRFRPLGNIYSLYLDALWPLPNVWLGVSVEDQRRAEERIPLLLDTPAAIRWISAEPLLGPMNLADLHDDIDWVVAGGESGPGARPMHPDWARSIRGQCAATGTPFLFKQWGAWIPTSAVDTYNFGPSKNEREFPHAEGVSMLADGRICLRDFPVREHARRMRERSAFSTRAIEVDRAALAAFHASTEDDSREEDNPLGYQWMYRIGKTAAGRTLDGVIHDGFPQFAGGARPNGRRPSSGAPSEGRVAREDEQ